MLRLLSREREAVVATRARGVMVLFTVAMVMLCIMNGAALLGRWDRRGRGEIIIIIKALHVWRVTCGLSTSTVSTFGIRVLFPRTEAMPKSGVYPHMKLSVLGVGGGGSSSAVRTSGTV